MLDSFIGGKSLREVLRLFGYFTVHDNGDVVLHEYTPTWESYGYYNEGCKLRIGFIKDRNGCNLGAQINKPIDVLGDIIAIARCEIIFFHGALEDVADNVDGIAHLNNIGDAIASVYYAWLAH